MLLGGKLALTVLVTVFIARRIGLEVGDLAELGPGWWAPRWSLFVASCGAMLSVNFGAGLIWGRMVRDMGGPRVGGIDAIRVVTLANLGRYVPGKVWQVAGLVALAKRVGVSATVAAGAAVLGHGLSLGAATLVGGIAFARMTFFERVPGWTATAAVGVGLVALLTPPLFQRAAALWVRVARVERPAESISWRHAALWTLLFVAMWIAYGLCFVLLAASYGVGGAPLVLGPAFVAAYVIGYVAVFAPAGVGVREVALAGLLTPMIGAPVAAGLAVVARLWATVVEVVPGAIFLSRELGGGARPAAGSEAP